MAAAGGYGAAARARRVFRNGVYVCESSGKPTSAWGGHPRRARKAHRAARLEDARLVRRVHGGQAGRQRFAEMKACRDERPTRSLFTACAPDEDGRTGSSTTFEGGPL